MYRILIVEDDDREAMRLSSLLERYGTEYGKEFQIRCRTSAFDLPEEAGTADLVFLDIELPGTDGMKAARELRASGTDVPIIFCTNLAQYAVAGYAVSALDFIVKPVDYSALTLRMERAVHAMDSRHGQTLSVRAKEGVRIFRACDLVLVETRGHNIVYRLKDGTELTVRKALREAATELPSPPFLQTSSGSLINMAYVTGIEGSKIVLEDGADVFMSRSKRKGCLEALARYLGGSL